MITMLKFPNYGRLGNQIFQYLSLSGIAHKHNVPLRLPHWPYGHYFSHHPKGYAPNGWEIVTQEEKTPCYQEFDIQEKKINNLHGYFQDEKYFIDTPETFNFKAEYKEQIRQKFIKVLENKNIAICIRRTDYVSAGVYEQLPVSYYLLALQEHFPNWREYNLIFISDDLDYCKFHFGCLENAFFPKTKDIEQMCLASLCDNWILANSTFGWLAAWMGEKENSKVVQPKYLYTGKLLEKYGDINFYRDKWITFDHKDKKIDLKDCTFTIPVTYDHTDRKENLDLIVCLLQQVDTNIIIGENKTREFKYFEKWCKYVEFDYENFHRTKMLNQLAEKAETKFVANWDADVIVPPVQLFETVEKLREGADMVYPYAGVFNRVERKKMKDIFPSYDLGVFKDSPNGTPSFGGAVMWNRQKFFEAGGENENFISYGPEDVERYERAKRLEYKIKRTKGDLIHFNHFRGQDSTNKNKFFKANSDEMKKERNMNKEQQLEYIRSWSWFKPYSSSFYETISEEAVKSRDEVFKVLRWNRLYTEDKSVVDVGCGIGEWGTGLENYTGLDYQIPKDKLLIENYIEHDLRTPLVLNKKFDLVLCLEVAEHLEEEYADTLIDTLCNLGDTILFSAAIPGQGGVNHVNCQWQSYWVNKFSERRYIYSLYVRNRIYHNQDVCTWYKNNIILFSKKRSYDIDEDISCEIDFVHPEMYKSCMKIK